MQRDIRGTSRYRDAEHLYIDAHAPGTGQVTDLGDLDVCPTGQYVTITGALADGVDGGPLNRVCEVNLATGELRVLTFGPNSDRSPRYSPDGHSIAYLSDRLKSGDFQLYILDRASGASRVASTVDGWVEYLRWSPDGKRILLGVAGHGADISGGQGAVSSKKSSEDLPAWMPTIDSGDESFKWRHIWIFELATNTVKRVSIQDCNVWEAAWCGNSKIVAIASNGSAEGTWYAATLNAVDIESGEVSEIFCPGDQIGLPACSSDGERVVVVEAVCSDRLLVCGNVILLSKSGGVSGRLNTNDVDISYVEWGSEHLLVLAGYRGFETVVGTFDVREGQFHEIWSSTERAITGKSPAVSSSGGGSVIVFGSEGFFAPPEICVIENKHFRCARSLAISSTPSWKSTAQTKTVSWPGANGLEMMGWLLTPNGDGPFPLIVNVHGGPVWHWKPTWLARARTIPIAMLLMRGYAVFLPNPRGSSGRGQEFARLVKGDINGADAKDLLLGVDHLTARGFVSPNHVGVMGISYGGNMTAWLIGQDTRFAAAVTVSPHTNQVTQHLLSNIPTFVSLFLSDTFTRPNSKYYERSPIMYAHRVSTPTLNICGALDRCTPPEEAMQFHSALLENNVESMLAIYPLEGHGVGQFPAAFDYAARVVGWFDYHLKGEAVI